MIYLVKIESFTFTLNLIQFIRNMIYLKSHLTEKIETSEIWTDDWSIYDRRYGRLWSLNYHVYTCGFGDSLYYDVSEILLLIVTEILKRFDICFLLKKSSYMIIERLWKYNSISKTKMILDCWLLILDLPTVSSL